MRQPAGPLRPTGCLVITTERILRRSFLLLRLLSAGTPPPSPSSAYRTFFGALRCHELYDGHLRGIAAPEPELDDPRVTSRPVFEPRSNNIEQFSHYGFVLNDT